jgi:hypothetical protein
MIRIYVIIISLNVSTCSTQKSGQLDMIKVMKSFSNNLHFLSSNFISIIITHCLFIDIAKINVALTIFCCQQNNALIDVTTVLNTQKADTVKAVLDG